MIRILLTFLFVFCSIPASAGWQPDFTVHKFGSGGPVVLVVGGIQGDEPGGFSAAALLASQYHFTKGSVWVVPNLNFPSIIERSRGLHGDMNRKFALLADTDPEFATVRRIQQLVTAPEVDMVLNLHDGSGLYRPTFENSNRNPNRWGQAVIIDLPVIPGHPQGDLEARAGRVVRQVNKTLLQKHHLYHLKNTHTDRGNEEMEKCLTWFAVRNGKPAYGLEVSKDFTVEGRTYYHLQAVEAFFRQVGVEFSRSFPLTFRGVRTALQSDISVGFDGESVRLPLEDVRPKISGFIPLPRDLYERLSVSKPILAVLGDARELRVHYGNRLLTRFTPEWHDQIDPVAEFSLLVDGVARTIRPGEVVTVRHAFQVLGRPDIRINAIGAELGRDESNMTIEKRHFRTQYSVDTGKTLFRVEAYRDKDFAGMFLVRFGVEQVVARRDYLPDVPGPESDQGM